MNKFVHALSQPEIAEQVAALLNTYSNLALQRTSLDIQDSKTSYIVESHGRHVIGACGLHKLTYQLTELKHLVVIPPWRRQGVGRFLVKRAIALCSTPVLYATVRRDNSPSLQLFKSLGFEVGTDYTNEDHGVIFLVRASSKWTTPAPSKLASGPAVPLTTETEFSMPE